MDSQSGELNMLLRNGTKIQRLVAFISTVLKIAHSIPWSVWKRRVPCHDQKRRSLLVTALAAGACMATRSVAAEDQPGSDERPQKGDTLVLSNGEHEGEIIKPGDLKLGGPPLRAWPKDSKTLVIRNGSRLNEILVPKLDASDLDDATRARAAKGIVAYSAICAHAACPVSEWVKAEQGGEYVLKCPCHNSEYDPRQGAQVVFGPAPRRFGSASDGDCRRYVCGSRIICRESWRPIGRLTLASKLTASPARGRTVSRKA